MQDKDRILGSGFLRSCEQFADRPAVVADGQTVTYHQLRDRACSLAATMQCLSVGGVEPSLTAVFAYRTVTAFAGILAALLRGHGYVPLNPTFPAARNRAMLQRAGCRVLIVDEESAAHLDEFLDGIEQGLVVVLPDVANVTAISAKWSSHRFLGSNDLLAADKLQPTTVNSDNIAYLLFTSGSTGVPKGVGVTHQNALALIDTLVERYSVTENDRLSQTFDMTFDLSVFDMFVAWECGAQVCCPSRKQLLTPAAFIRECEISIWYCVPSLGVLMHRLRLLEPAAFPGLRLSLFCGEALPMDVAQAWAQAAPNSIVENLYGPTEATVSCLWYRWDNEKSPAECENGVVPIGEVHPDMNALIVDEELHEVAPGDAGELLVSGAQVTPGYWHDAAKTASVFVVPPGSSDIYYRTGDQVRRPTDGGPITYLGRTDHQIKLHGFRIELGEIEVALREVAGVDQAVAIGWPLTPAGPQGIVGFLAEESADTECVLSGLRKRLPTYMVPRELRLLREFPLNTNGKIDRNALVKILED